MYAMASPVATDSVTPRGFEPPHEAQQLPPHMRTAIADRRFGHQLGFSFTASRIYRISIFPSTSARSYATGTRHSYYIVKPW